MAYRIPTAKGYWLIDDDKRVALSIAYTEEGREWLHETVRLKLHEHKAQLAGLVMVCDEDRKVNDAITQRLIYFAHPGTYRFVETKVAA